MTKITTDEVECQACGSKQNVEIFESINVTNQPELKEKLFQGQLNILNRLFLLLTWNLYSKKLAL